MQKILVLYAHPSPRHSRVNASMARRASVLEQVTFVDLYAEYPRFKIDVEREQQRLIDHDVIVMQFPMMWYSTPSLLKEWQDLVLEYGFAYGENGDKLAGKNFAIAVSTGSPEDTYALDGAQKHELHTLLAPLLQTAALCKMPALPPYVLFDALHAADNGCITPHVDGYCNYLRALRDRKLDAAQLQHMPLIGAVQMAELMERIDD